MPAKLKPMSPVDAGWYHMDNSTNLAMVTGVCFDPRTTRFRTRQGGVCHRSALL